MSATETHQRQMEMLKRIASLAKYRTDVFVRLSEFDTGLALFDFPSPRGLCIAEVDGAGRATNTEITHDLNRLRDDLLITCGKYTKGYCIQITQSGLNQVAELERSWLSKAIDKQPMTALQVLFLVLNFGWACFLGFYTWLIMRQ